MSRKEERAASARFFPGQPVWYSCRENLHRAVVVQVGRRVKIDILPSPSRRAITSRWVIAYYLSSRKEHP